MFTVNYLVKEIEITMKEIAREIGCTPTSITKATGFSPDSKTYEIIHTALKLTSLKAWNRYSVEEYREVVGMIQNISLEVRGLN